MKIGNSINIKLAAENPDMNSVMASQVVKSVLVMARRSEIHVSLFIG